MPRAGFVLFLLAAFVPGLARPQPTAAREVRAVAAIVRLRPSAFAQLPLAVRRDLERRGCRVPQTFASAARHNVIRGAFTARGSAEWAVLCSIADTSRILVYGRDVLADSLERQADRNYLQDVKEVAPYGLGFSRRIGVAPPAVIRMYANELSSSPPPSVDHDAIEDSFVEKASKLFYFVRGRWRILQGMD